MWRLTSPDIVVGGMRVSGERLDGRGRGQHGEKGGYSYVESIPGKKVGHNFTYQRADLVPKQAKRDSVL